MLHPFLRRRAGRELPDPLHPSLAEVLDRTLGVPLFQEQLMRMAMVAAGFTGGQAEELRRAMGFKRSTERMRVVEAELRAGMDRNGIDAAAQEKIVKSITSFALYGFPESHAASFALIAYASCWLKVWHPAAFFAALLNNWPMGFYHPASLVRDALRWGVEVRPVDVTVSNWLCTLEPAGPAIENEDEMIKREYIAEASNRLGGYKRGHLGPALRVGLRYVRGLGEEVGRRIEAARAERDLASPSDLAARASVPRAVMTALAEGGALGGFGAGRREALWQVEAIGRSGALFEHVQDGDIQGGHVEGDHVLAEMSEAERLEADYRVAGLSVGRHPMALYRDELRRSGTVTADDLVRLPAGRRVRVAGQLIVRQRPGSAKGFFFFTLEDETGLANGIVTPSMFLANRPLLVSAAALLVEGVLQRLDGTVSVKADRFFPLSTIVVPSRDFH